jgi:hypothetical protein
MRSTSFVARGYWSRGNKKDGKMSSRPFWYCYAIGLAVANVHRDFKTKTHFGSLGLGPHGAFSFQVDLANTCLTVPMLGRSLPQAFRQIINPA